MPVDPPAKTSPSSTRSAPRRLLLIAGLLSSLLTGCTKAYMWQVESDLCMDADFHSKQGAAVSAYTTRDSTRFAFDGRAWLRSDGMVIFDTSSRRVDTPLDEHPDTRFARRRSDLLAIEYRKPDPVANSFIAGFCSAVLIFGIWMWSLD